MSDYKRIFLSPPHMSGREQDFVRQAFESNYIAPHGPMVDAFEREMAAYIDIPHCLAVDSGTSAMHLALRCMGVSPGDVVVASTLTFIGSVSPVFFQGATVLFVDADPSTWNMHPEGLREALELCHRRGKVPRAVIPTDLYGQCCDYDRLKAACEPFNVPLVVDSAEAMGARYQGRHAGKGAYAAVFSFNGNKIITTSGGGLLASEDQNLIQHARKLSQQAREPFPYYEHVEIGYNYRMSNILAAIGRSQLQALEERVQARRRIFDYYARSLSGLPGVSFMPEAAYGRASRWLTVMLLDPEPGGPTSETIRLTLEAHNIEARPVWKPMHLQPVFANYACIGGKVSEQIFERGLCLPSGTAMTDHDLARITELICSCFRKP
jgi:dTDP-4-amino-4,6-dideoxygalactose transaminase